MTRALCALLCVLCLNVTDAQERDRHGRILRKPSARVAFMKLSGYPKGRPGYVIDHIIPLCAGGPDVVDNLQWQTIAEAKAKDRIEKRDCAIYRRRNAR